MSGIDIWSPDKHSLMTVATSIKKVFMTHSFDKFTDAPNKEAMQL